MARTGGNGGEWHDRRLQDRFYGVILFILFEPRLQNGCHKTFLAELLGR